MNRQTGVRAELWTLVRLALPLAAAQVGLMAMGFVDVAITGRLGAATTAVGLGNGITLTVSILGLGIMMGLDPLVAGVVYGRGVVGLWYGLAAGLTAVACALFVRFLRLSAKPIRAIAHGREEAARNEIAA